MTELCQCETDAAEIASPYPCHRCGQPRFTPPDADDANCPTCGLLFEDDNNTTHECPPGFLEPITVYPSAPPDSEAKATAKILADSEQYPEGPEAHLAEVMLEDAASEKARESLVAVELKVLPNRSPAFISGLRVGFDAGWNAREEEVERLKDALASIRDMPDYDQDDEYRLRNIARRALEKEK